MIFRMDRRCRVLIYEITSRAERVSQASSYEHDECKDDDKLTEARGTGIETY